MRISKQWFMQEFVHETGPIAKVVALAVASLSLIWLYAVAGVAAPWLWGLRLLFPLALIWWAHYMDYSPGWVGSARLSDLPPDAWVRLTGWAWLFLWPLVWWVLF